VVVLDHDGVTGPLWRRRAVSAQVRADLPAHIPSLEELYRTCGAGYELSLDVKDPAALPGILDAAIAAEAEARLWLCHQDWRLMAGWRASAGRAHLVESTNLAWMHEGLGPRLAALRDAGVDALNLHRSQWNHAVLAEAHAAGLRAFAWDAHRREDLDVLLDLGVDGVYSDHVRLMMDAIGARWPA